MKRYLVFCLVATLGLSACSDDAPEPGRVATLYLDGAPGQENPLLKVDVTHATVAQLTDELKASKVMWERAGLMCINYRDKLPPDPITNVVAFDITGDSAVQVLSRDPALAIDQVCQERAAML